ncbi:MAG: 5-formyltetrahydrofolate cyclo-ligase [Desulfobacula sp.]|jgi:5-formyltetrahydrofolate cyclo-ligase|uniref:5-formyltetrahydrofolate cyclo-ligase n=1 Tax=Desulfobacula sp. TaxID=2593537 RepID=UPI001D5BAAEF|nr:5-formyltetrahydrofolate cyclo-ligase [Desulfobacula sp.]MBT3485085.1 5-formyltetrahydrofolate cyclo-ligase [Desulfobacula sp.]MBT3804611.1 5-formyltetrahydrofolate cyclo-ligase [Desulfobacula sp.]MBT4025096.1 5-formyltetrahydrofolate cyclo-ligase [Desulfobacula sp.]MBT4198249.1 5-formyltetrahydrofolate cyclo-ligase [Desulfobacula sp.]
MDELKNGKINNLTLVAKRLENLAKEELFEKYKKIEYKLFEFANFMEAQLAFLYTPTNNEIPTEKIIKKALQIEKGIALPVFTYAKNAINLYKINNYDKDLIKSANDILEPDIEKCKKIPLEEVDIAIIPGLAFDDKGGRIGFGNNFYNKLITKLPETCRKVSLAYEEQIVDQIQMESRKFTVDIIITDKRVIYKI